MNFIN